jgi:hypothetical protein
MASTNYDLWQSGSMLREAWKLHCDAAIRERIEEIGVEVLEAFVGTLQTNSFGGLLSAFGLNQPYEEMKVLVAHLDEAREEIVIDLYNSELAGIGQVGFGTTSRKFEIIPAEFWYDAAPDWKADTARTNDREFIRIRVIDPHKHPHLLHKRGPGRPGVRAKLFEAMEFIERNEILTIKTATHKAVLIEILNYYSSRNENDYREIARLDISTVRKAITAFRNR